MSLINHVSVMIYSLKHDKLAPMQLRKILKNYYWWCPLLMYSVDANAWGLFTHLYFAQSLIMSMPLLDPKLRSAIKKFPELVLAGACLPDLAIISKKFHTSHQWQQAERMLNIAQSEEEIAIAIGYASHLYVDVIAHNHFVPAHEALWNDQSILTHIASEWAMDAHLAKYITHTPGQLLTRHIKIISPIVGNCFACSEHKTYKTLKQLAFADSLLRLVKLPQIINQVIRITDRNVSKTFAYYMIKTELALIDFNKALQGHHPVWEPELKHLSLDELGDWRTRCLNDLTQDLAVPINYY